MGCRRKDSDSSEDLSSSEYSGSSRKRHREDSEGLVTRLRPRAARNKTIVYQDIDSEIDDFLESEDEEETTKGALENLPVALYNTIEKFLARRSKQKPKHHTEFLPPAHPPPRLIHSLGDHTNSDARHEEHTNSNKISSPSYAVIEPISTNSISQSNEFPFVSSMTTSKNEPLRDPLISSEQNLSSTDDNITSSNKVSQDGNDEIINGIAAEKSPVGESMGGDLATLELEETGSIVTPSERGRPSSRCLITSLAVKRRLPHHSRKQPEYEYLVKYHNVSFLHVEWLTESEVQEALAHDRPLRTRFNNFIRKLEAGQDIPELELLDCGVDRIVDCSDIFRALYPTKAAEISKNDWTMYCLRIVDAIVCFTRDNRNYGIPFLRPVEEDKDNAPGYHAVVKNPMDFSTVQTKLYLRQYESPQEFWTEVKLIFSNCSDYNASRTDICTQCRVLEALFDRLYHEWAKVSRGENGGPVVQEPELPFITLDTEGISPQQVIQHISFKKQLKEQNRQILYLVKWKGRSYTEMSWELASDITDKLKIAQYHRHVRVPEYVIDAKGAAFWEVDLQRKMLQETLTHVKAAREYLLGNMAVSVASLPQLSSGGQSHIPRERWSYNFQQQHHLRESHHHHMHGMQRQKGPTTAAAAASAAADNEQRQAMMRRAALMVGTGGGMMTPGIINPPHMAAYGGGLPIPSGYGFMGPQWGSAELYNPMMMGRYFGNPAVAAAADVNQRLVSTTTGQPIPPPMMNPQMFNPALYQLMAQQAVAGSAQGYPSFMGQPVLPQQTGLNPQQSIAMGSLSQQAGAQMRTQFLQQPNLQSSRPPFGTSVPAPMQGVTQSDISSSVLVSSLQPRVQETPRQALPTLSEQEGMQNLVSPQETVLVPNGTQITQAKEGGAISASLAPEQTCEGGKSTATKNQNDRQVSKNEQSELISSGGREEHYTPLREVMSGDYLPRQIWSSSLMTVSELRMVLPAQLQLRIVESKKIEVHKRIEEEFSLTSALSLDVECRNFDLDERTGWCEGGEEAHETLSIHTQKPSGNGENGRVRFNEEQLTGSHSTMSTDDLSSNIGAEVPVQASTNADGGSELLSKMNIVVDVKSEKTEQLRHPKPFETTTASETSGAENTERDINPKDDSKQSTNDYEKEQKKDENDGDAKTDVDEVMSTETKLTGQVKTEELKPKPPTLDRSRPASFAAKSIYSEQFANAKKPKAPPPGISRHYHVSPVYKGGRKLFDYQLDGLNWLLDLWSSGNNGILADEMGLGKTVQTMAFLWHLFTKEKFRGPFLVVAPLSTLDHWKRTADDWTDFNSVLYYDEGGRAGRDALRRAEWYHYMLDWGPKRPVTQSNGKVIEKPNPRIIPTWHYKFQLLLTSYEIFASDADLLVAIPWQFVAVDEAHRLKNRLSKTLGILKQVGCRHTLLLTGTPVQNNTEELWPLLNYIEPVRFCDLDAFKIEFGELQTTEQVSRLTDLLRPHLLRRVKEDVAESIPPLEETIIDVELTMIQKAYYKAIYERNKTFLFKNLKKGQAVPSLMNIEMELRKCCNHPFMIQGVEQREYATCKNEQEQYKKLIESSGKLVLLSKLLPKLKTEDHKVLIFSQFQHTLTIIQEFLTYQGWEYERIDGAVKGNERASAIARFNDASLNKFVFLLSTRAGGLGINLTSADTVIIFDSDWNPQNDVQATARAHRIGQEREVKVYRLVTARTYEADMFDRASKKLGLNTAVFHRGAFDSKTRTGSGKEGDETVGLTGSGAKAPSKEEIEELLKKGAFYLLEGHNEAARQFQEGDIEEILSRNSRLVRYQLTGMSSSFAKTSFRSDKSSDLSLDDPDFWKKVLNDSSSRRLLARLNDGSATATDEAMEEFMTDLQAAVEGIAAEDDPEPVIEALVQMSNLTTFSAEHRQNAEDWLARVNANLDILGEAPGDKSVSSPIGTPHNEVDEDGRPTRRSARVSSTIHYIPDELEKEKKRGKRGEDDHDLKRFQRNLASKFEESERRVLYSRSIDDMLSEPSEEEEDDDELDESRPKKRGRASAKPKARSTPRAKRKPRKSKLTLADSAEFDPETAAEVASAAIAAGIPIDEVPTLKKSRKPRTPGAATKRKRPVKTESEHVDEAAEGSPGKRRRAETALRRSPKKRTASEITQEPEDSESLATVAKRLASEIAVGLPPIIDEREELMELDTTETVFAQRDLLNHIEVSDRRLPNTEPESSLQAVIGLDRPTKEVAEQPLLDTLSTESIVSGRIMQQQLLEDQ